MQELAQALESNEFSEINRLLSVVIPSDKNYEVFELLLKKYNENADYKLIEILSKLELPKEAIGQLDNITRARMTQGASTKDIIQNLGVSEPNMIYYLLLDNPRFINKQDDSGNTILHHMLIHPRTDLNQVALIKFLVNISNINFNIKNDDEMTSLHCAATQCNYRKRDCQQMRENIFPIMIEQAEQHGFDFSIKGDRGAPLLYRTAQYGSEQNILSVLEHSKAVVNFVGQSECTALYLTIRKGHLQAAQALLLAGADPSLGCDGRKAINAIEELERNTELCSGKEEQIAALKRQITTQTSRSTFSNLFGGNKPPLIERLDTFINSRPYWRPTDQQRRERAAFELLKTWMQRPGADPKKELESWKDSAVEVAPLFGASTVVTINQIISHSAIKEEVNELYELLGLEKPYQISSSAPSAQLNEIDEL